MSKESPKAPPQSDLPPPRVLWVGQADAVIGKRPARVVQTYKWVRSDGESEWTVSSDYVLEIADTADAMNQPTFAKRPMTELPVAFFRDVFAAALPDPSQRNAI